MRIWIGIVAGRPDFLPAEFAVPAGNGEGHHHAIAALQVSNIPSRFFYNAHELVAQDIAFLHRRDKSVEQMEIGSANGRPRDFDNRVVRIQNRGIWHRVNFHLTCSHPA